MNFGVGQISSMNAEELKDLKKRLLPMMKHECGKNGISMVFLCLQIFWKNHQKLSVMEMAAENW